MILPCYPGCIYFARRSLSHAQDMVAYSINLLTLGLFVLHSQAVLRVPTNGKAK